MSVRTATLRRLLAWLMPVVLVASLGLWLLSREPLPDRIRIATAAPGGLYHRVGELLAEPLAARLGRPVEVLVSAGSEQNARWLKSGEAELALVQGELADQPGVGVLAPLYPDVLLVVVRRDAGIGELGDLAGRNVAIGLT